MFANLFQDALGISDLGQTGELLDDGLQSLFLVLVKNESRSTPMVSLPWPPWPVFPSHRNPVPILVSVKPENMPHIVRNIIITTLLKRWKNLLNPNWIKS